MTGKAYRRISDADYGRLASFRLALRRFLRFSENEARRVGISPAQYQLLLFVRGFPGPPPAIATLAERLQITHHSAVGLVDRSVRSGLVRRVRDSVDARRVRVELSPRGAAVLQRLVRAHSPEVDRLSAALFRVPTR